MNRVFLSTAIGCFIGFSACSSGSRTGKTDARSMDVGGKVYIWAPEIDTANKSVTGACDCCSGEILFLNQTDCIWLDICEGTTSVAKGKYRQSVDAIELEFGKTIASRYFNPEREVDTNAQPEYLLEKQTIKARKIMLEPVVVDNTVYLRILNGELYYAVPTNETLETRIDNLKSDGLFQLMND
ncbi:MAG: hypothetical protein KF744_15385 [Taibaiella sp.]|nr:hypothetical protein [Taibaiella sp.]